MGRYLEIITTEETGPPKPLILPLLIGGGKDCQIPVPGAAKALCLLGEEKGHLYVQTVSEDEVVFLNNERIKAPSWIKSGDFVRLGNAILFFTITSDLVSVSVKSVQEFQESEMGAPFDSLRRIDKNDPGPPLPRVAKPPINRRSPSVKRAATALSLFLLLSLSAFLLLAKGFRVSIEPEPDEIKISGPFPVIRLGKGFAGIGGKYGLFAKKAGYRDLAAEIDLKEGNTTFSFKMRPLPGIVDIYSTPAGAKTVMDGKDLGQTPLKNKKVEQGRHLLKLSLPGYKELEKNIEVRGLGQAQRFTFTLLPSTGKITLKTLPPGAKIKVNKKGTDKKTPATLTLPEGSYLFSFHLPGYAERSVEAEVKAGENSTIPAIKLEKGPGILHLSSLPPGALALIDGVYAGRTPLKIELSPEKKHLVSLSSKGHLPVEKRVSLRPGQEKRLFLKLKPQFGNIMVTSDPEELVLFIDGKKQQKNAGKFTLLASKHTIKAKCPGYRSRSFNITLLPGATRALDIRLKRASASPNLKEGQRSAKSPRLILVHPHAFVMGSSRREQGRRTNEVQRQVNLKRPFYISRNLVTNREFRRFRPNHSSGTFKGYSLDGDSQPVVNVSWDDAARYCNWLSKRHGLPEFYKEIDGRMFTATPANTGYRLPTEAEWAYTARAMNRDRPARYPWGGDYPPRLKSGNYADESARGILLSVIRGYNDSFPVTSPVGSFGANPAGLFDIGGNVSEWCHDFYSPLGAVQKTDPLGPAEGTHHVVRGSSWRAYSITELRLSYRDYARRGENYIGFRVCRYAR